MKYAPAEGETPRPLPRRYEAALRFLKRPRFVDGPVFKDMRLRAHYGDCEPDIRRYALRLYAEFAGHGIPVRVHVFDHSIDLTGFACEWLRRGVSPIDEDHGRHVHGRLMMIEHAQLGLDLPPMCWEVMRAIASAAAVRVEAGLLVTGYAIEHPWMLAVDHGSRDAEGEAAKAEFKRLEREWYRNFNRSGGGA